MATPSVPTPSDISTIFPTGVSAITGEAGRRFGDYRLVRIISEGGMGVVLEAIHTGLGRRVALKTVSPRCFDRYQIDFRQITSWFLSEAAMMGAVNHPNVLQLFESGMARGEDMTVDVPFLAMRLVGHGDLVDRVNRQGHIRPVLALRIASDCAQALAAIHAAGIVHRDIKPANILLDGGWQPLITDFSLAVGRNAPSSDPRVVGTPGYLAPEVIRGAQANALSDIYALGATIYYILTGHPPSTLTIDGELRANLMPSDRRTGERTLRRAMVEIIEKALAHDPEDRYVSAQDLVEDCAHVLEGRQPRHALNRIRPVRTPGDPQA